MSKQKSIIIGLTGPIASGKSTVCKLLRRRRAYVIEADSIGHEVIEPQTPAWHEIIKNFGVRVLLRGGRVNRRKLGEIVFRNPKALKQLNKITHPLMAEKIKEIVNQAKKENRKLVVINAAVLKEMGLIPLVDQVWVVMASQENRLKRLIKYKKLSKAQAQARIKAQGGVKKYLKVADVVIRNDGTVNNLKGQVKKLLTSSLKL